MIPLIFTPPKIMVELVPDSGNDEIILGFILGLVSSLILSIFEYIKRKRSLRLDLKVKVALFCTYYEQDKATFKTQATGVLGEIITVYTELTQYRFRRKTILEKIKTLQQYIVRYDGTDNIDEKLLELLSKNLS